MTPGSNHPDGQGKVSDGTPGNHGRRRPQRVNASDPIEKRKRILHACDECRRKKIKCDGKKPCAHCAVYDYKCTYDDPYKRGRNTSPRRVEALEVRLQKTESLLRILEPNLNLNELYLNNNSPEDIARNLRRDTFKLSIGAQKTTLDETPDGPLLGTMMENFGALDLDDKGRWNYHGHSSTILFMQSLQNQFGNLISPISAFPGCTPTVRDPALGNGIRQVPGKDSIYDLPPHTQARELCRTSFDQACILTRFVHEPSFWASFDRIYATLWDGHGAEERAFLPLLYAAMAVGCLYSDGGNSASATEYESLFEKGFTFFKTCRTLLDPTNCRDLTSLQAMIFMILFLQSSTELCACYPYIGIAQRAALHLGLHRNIQGNFNPIERELRKRIFWVIRTMDVYVSTRRGLPILVNSDDIDQEYPLDIDDEFITPVGVLPMPSSRIPLMAGANAQARLLDIIIVVMRTVYPVKLARHQEKSDHTYTVSYSKIQEIEASLEEWENQVASTLHTEGGNTPDSPAMERMAGLLRLAHAHVQWTLYRPFLHFAARGQQAEGTDRRRYLCAAACVNASRKIIQIVKELHQKAMLSGSHWFTTHTTYFAILTLVYFILENQQQSTVSRDDIEAAFEGKSILEDLAANGLAVERCSSLRALFQRLPETIHNAGNGLRTTAVYPSTGQGLTQLHGQVISNAGNSNSSLDTLPTVQGFPASALDQPTGWPEWFPSHYQASADYPDLMPLSLPPEFNVIQADNIDFTGFASGDMGIFDEMYMRFGMDRYDTDNPG